MTSLLILDAAKAHVPAHPPQGHPPGTDFRDVLMALRSPTKNSTGSHDDPAPLPPTHPTEALPPNSPLSGVPPLSQVPQTLSSPRLVINAVASVSGIATGTHQTTVPLPPLQPVETLAPQPRPTVVELPPVALPTMNSIPKPVPMRVSSSPLPLPQSGTSSLPATWAATLDEGLRLISNSSFHPIVDTGPRAASVPWVAQTAPTGMPALVRLYPLELNATGYLSELLMAFENVNEPNMGARASIDAVAMDHTTGAAETSRDLTPADDSSMPAADRLSIPLDLIAPVSDDDRVHAPKESTSLLPVAAAMAPEPWAQRLLCVIPESSGGIALWLRDYRIDPRHWVSLGEQLAREGQAAGHPVRCVYINGHPMWSAVAANHPHSGA